MSVRGERLAGFGISCGYLGAAVCGAHPDPAVLVPIAVFAMSGPRRRVARRLTSKDGERIPWTDLRSAALLKLD